MDVTALTWIIAILGLVLIGLLGSLQLVAIIRPQSEWTIENVYGGEPNRGNATAYFAVNQGYAWADAVFWAPLQVVGSIGMLAGQRWGFLLALIASVPFWYTAVTLFVWDRAMGFRKPTAAYWVTWGIWPVFGIVEGAYCFVRLLE